MIYHRMRSTDTSSCSPHHIGSYASDVNRARLIAFALVGGVEHHRASMDNTEPSNVIDAIHGYRVVGSVDEMDDDAMDGGGDSGDDDSGCRSTFTPP